MRGYSRWLTLSTFFVMVIPISLYAQERVLDIGARFQKTVNLYLENGITAQYSCSSLFSERLYLGFSYFSSRLGTALGTNALKQDNILLSASWLTRPNRLLRPMARANIGYFTADYESDLFQDLPNNSMLLSAEGGLSFNFKSPIKMSMSLGYNLITGDGIKGPGTIYPVYIQTSVTWNILHKK
jgi:hypothetical protein